MNFAELKLSIETLVGVEFRFKPAEDDHSFYNGNRWILYSALGDIVLRDERSVRYKGCGDYSDNMTFPEDGDLSPVYRWILASVQLHNERKETRLAYMREALPDIQALGKMQVEFVEQLDTINPVISAQKNGIELFRVVPRFRGAFVQFSEDGLVGDESEEESGEIHNGFDCPVRKIEERIKPLPSGLHVFRIGKGGEIEFGMRAFMTPNCTVRVHELTVEKRFNKMVFTEHPFYKRLLREETVKVVEYSVP